MDNGRFRNCPCCTTEIEEEVSIHNATGKHIFNHLLYQWVNHKKKLVKNRHGCEVVIKPIQENGKVFNYTENLNKGKHTVELTPSEFKSFGNKIRFSCKIKNFQNKKNVILAGANLLHPYIYYSLKDPNGLLEEGNALELEPGGEYKVEVVFESKQNNLVGSYKIPICFNFQTIQTSRDAAFRFTIARSVNIIISEKGEEANEQYEGKSPFTSHDWPKNIDVILPNKAPPFLDDYVIPSNYKYLLKLGLEDSPKLTLQQHQLLRILRQTVYLERVTADKYAEYWHIVLWLEEIGQAIGLQRYNMENVHLKLHGKTLELEVPGLAEKRPSVIAGDFIEVKIQNDYRAYRGVIRYVHDKTIEIHEINDELIDFLSNNPDVAKEMEVRFVPSRLNFERMHQAVEQIDKNGMIMDLFPDALLTVKRRPTSFIKLTESQYFNKMVYTNPEQKIAVQNILNGTSGTAPYIVFGPPGTGKTVTIVEAILQIKRQTNKRILICAPANAACDLLAEKLIPYCDKKELLRIMSNTVVVNTIHSNVLEFSNYVGDNEFRIVQPEELFNYRIIISTLIHIGKFTRKYHPDVVFIDEAAQACEPEADCAIAMLGKDNTTRQIILAGDPHQLGPSFSSKVAEKYGYGISLLERLMKLDIYESRDPNFIAKLLQNFRSHSLILKIPNDEFYDGELMAMSGFAENDPLAKVFIYNKIQGKTQATMKKEGPGQAIEFCSVLSKERRQGRSPSYFNEKEMLMVLKYIQALMSLSFENKKYNVKQEEIGIVTPYIRQVYKLKEILKRHEYDGIEVGTTETFQGREKRVIIVTTVRAQKDLLLYDKKYKLGFVKNEKRFNVALTRAMSKLIIIGCAQVLATDSKWSKYMDLSKDYKAFFGAPYTRRDQNIISDITNRFAKVELRNNPHD